MPVLLLKTPHGNQIYPLTEGKPLFIGRARECDIHLALPAVSRRHAVVLFKNGVCGVKDLGSFNGTQVNGSVLTSPMRLLVGDVMTISSFAFILLDHPPAESVAPLAETAFAAESAPAGAMPAEAAPATDDSPNVTMPEPGFAKDMTPEEALEQLVQDIEPSWGSKGGGAWENRGGGISPAKPSRYGGGEAGPYDTVAQKPVMDISEPDDPDTDPVAGSPPSPYETAYFLESADSGDAAAVPGSDTLKGAAAGASVPENAGIPLVGPDDGMQLTVSGSPDEPAPDPVTGGIPDTSDTGMYSLPPDSGTEVEFEDVADFTNGGSITAAVTEAIPEKHAAVSIAENNDRFFGHAAGSSGSARIRMGAGGDNDTVTPVDISPALMAAIEARLSMYVLLQDLADERKLLLSDPELTPEAEAELARQEAELDHMPIASEAARLINELRELRDPDDGKDTRDPILRSAEEMALAQWTLLCDSSREALPVVFKEAYRLGADEPLAKDLADAGISHGRLIGSAVYLLALEALVHVANEERSRLGARLRAVNGELGDEAGVFNKLIRMIDSFKNRQEKRVEAEKVAEEMRANSMRASFLAREMKFAERLAIREFWQVYARTALHFIPLYDQMPLAVRAFLRHGAVGFKPWWMTAPVRDFILRDCEENVLGSFENTTGEIAVLYADEYLAAVAHMECSPSPNEALINYDRGSVEWRTDRGYRRIVNSRTYNVLMQDLLAGLGYRKRDYKSEASELGDRIAAITSRPHNQSEVTDLETQQQMLLMRCESLDRQVKRIEEEIVASILAAMEEAEGRFRRGELTMPDEAALIRGELDAILDIAARMSNSRDHFMPMAIRRYSAPGLNTINDRDSVRSQLADLEQLDPGIFMSTIVPAKRRDNRIEMRLCPTVVIVPVVGYSCVCSMGRAGMEGGRLAVPVCFAKPDLRERQMCNLLADFRWETSRHLGGLDLMNSDTLAGHVMRIRWSWRNLAKPKREKGLIQSELSDSANWRKIYEIYLRDAMNGGRALFLRNPELYFAIIDRFIDLPDGVEVIKRQ